MKVVVDVTTEAREQLVRLLEQRTPDSADAVRFASLYIEGIIAQFHKHEGPPPEAIKRTGTHGVVWWWHYADGVWTVFRVTDQAGWFFSASVRTVHVFAFRERPTGL